jgi:hypothetical protein
MQSDNPPENTKKTLAALKISHDRSATQTTLYSVPKPIPAKGTGNDANNSQYIADSLADECYPSPNCVTHPESPHPKQIEPPTNVVNLFTKQYISAHKDLRILRVCAEHNGARMLYSTADRPERLVAVPILCWALLEDGSVSGIVPWLNQVLPCKAVESQFNIVWEGYYCSIVENIFVDAPAEVIATLSIAARFNGSVLTKNENALSNTAASVDNQADWHIVQEIPDPIGTHALLVNETSELLILTAVVSWTLDEYGRLHGMLADDSQIDKLPVLPGDGCLFSADEDTDFKCFFQRDIAEQIRIQNPETMEAIEELFNG